MDYGVLEDALRLNGSDFENCVTTASARAAGCQLIVTRDPKGFRHSSVRAFTPEAAGPLLAPTAS